MNDKELQQIEADISEQTAKSQDALTISVMREQTAKEEARTRSRLALLFIILYFVLLALILVGVPVYNAVMHQITPDYAPLILNVTDIIQVYSSIVGPLAGFVVAYYFKNK